MRTCTIRDGAVVCFGMFRSGWDPLPSDPFDPAWIVPGLPPDGPATAVVLLEEGPCALDTEGSLWCLDDVLQNPSCADPGLKRVFLSAPARAIASHERTICAVLVDGTVECAHQGGMWGCLSDFRRVVMPSGEALRDVRSLEAGEAVMDSGKVVEWRTLGFVARVVGDRTVPAAEVAAFWDHEHCVIDAEGKLLCSLAHDGAPIHASAVWCGPVSCAARAGRDLFRFGWPKLGGDAPPTRHVGVDPVSVDFSEHDGRGCMLSAGGRVHCWGRDSLLPRPEDRWRFQEVELPSELSPAALYGGGGSSP